MINGMATNLSKNIKTIEVIRKIYLSLLSCQLKFLNLSANRGSSATSKNESRKEHPIKNQGLLMKPRGSSE